MTSDSKTTPPAESASSDETERDDSFQLTPADLRTLRAFQRSYKHRYLNRILLLFMLGYCVLVGSASVYIAVQSFMGAKVAPTKNPAVGQNIEELFVTIKPYAQKIDFFRIGWTAILHALLLLYLGIKIYYRIRRLSIHTPRARLALKLARRLEELGEIEIPKN
jgi:hypothetical protein